MTSDSFFTQEPCPKGFDSREIVSRAIEFRNPPRIPYSFYYHPNATDIISVFSNPVTVNKPSELGQTYVDHWGITWELTGRGWDHAIGHPLADLSALADFRFPDLANSSSFESLVPICGHARDAGKYIVAANPVMMYEQVRSLMGFEDHMIAHFDQPDQLGELLDILADMTIACINRYAEYGAVDGFMTWEDWGLQTGLQMDMELFRQFYKPRYQKIIDAAHNAGMHYIWHNCGKVNEMLEDKIEMGVDVVQFDQPQLLGHNDLIEIIGGNLCMWNTVDIQWSVLDQVSAAEIEQEVEDMVKAYRPNEFGGGFIARHYPQPWDIDLSEEKQKVIYDAFMVNGCSISA
jgi:hypothetical protein